MPLDKQVERLDQAVKVILDRRRVSPSTLVMLQILAKDDRPEVVDTTVGLLSRHGVVARSLSLSTLLWGVVLSLAGWDRIHGHSGGRALGIGIMVLAACQTGLVLVLSSGPKTKVPERPSQDTTSRFHDLAMALGLLALIAALLAT